MSRRVFCARCGAEEPCDCPAQSIRDRGSRFAKVTAVYCGLLEQGVDPEAAMFKAARAVEGEPS